MGIFSFLRRRKNEVPARQGLASQRGYPVRGFSPARPVASPAPALTRQRAAEALAAARKQKQRQESWQNAWQFWQKNYRFFIFPLIFLVAILLTWLASLWLRSTNYLEVKQIRVVGNEQLQAEQITDVLQSYIGQSMMGLRSGDLERQVRDSFAFVDRVYVRKILPDALEVEVGERFPEYVYINLAGAYLIDREGIVIRKIAYEARPDFSQEERAIIDGFIDLSSDRIQERYYAAWEAEQVELNKDKPGFKISDLERPKWEDVPRDSKQAIAGQLQQEFNVLLNDSFALYEQDIEDLNIDDLQRFFSISNEEWWEGQRFSRDKVQFYAAAKDYLRINEYEITQLTWRNDFNIRLRIKPGGTTIVFTSIKSYEQQLVALDAIKKVENLSRLREVDLRGELVSVTPK